MKYLPGLVISILLPCVCNSQETVCNPYTNTCVRTICYYYYGIPSCYQQPIPYQSPQNEYQQPIPYQSPQMSINNLYLLKLLHVNIKKLYLLKLLHMNIKKFLILYTVILMIEGKSMEKLLEKK